MTPRIRFTTPLGRPRDQTIPLPLLPHEHRDGLRRGRRGHPRPDQCADGFYPAEAAAEFLIGHASWLCREDFREGYVDVGTSIADGATTMAVIDWPAAIAALDGGGLPCSGGERRVLRLAASLAEGIPVDLRDAFTGMDTANVDRAVGAMLHASGRRSRRH
jgi:hypothetical protein